MNTSGPGFDFDQELTNRLVYLLICHKTQHACCQKDCDALSITERSAKLRNERFSERWTKSALKMEFLPFRELGYETEQKNNQVSDSSSQNFVHKGRGRSVMQSTLVPGAGVVRNRLLAIMNFSPPNCQSSRRNQ